jgi:pimeloyl-ACP methyl ester carboxylesterase
MTTRGASDRGTAAVGPLHAETVGLSTNPGMVFLHPNPMDWTAWLYQLAHFSTWFHCVAIDLPGYGRSGGCASTISMPEIASACWDVVDSRRPERDEPVVILGCSVGANVAQHMYHLRPDAVHSLVLTGCGWRADKAFAREHSAAYRERGLDYRYAYTLGDFSEEFADTALASWFATMYVERNSFADLEAIVSMFRAHGEPDPAWLQGRLDAPVLIVSGDQDNAHESAFALRERLPRSALVSIPGAGHACQVEQPSTFDAAVMDFLRREGFTLAGAAPSTG